MKKGFAIIFLLMVTIGCQKQVSPKDVAKINGYWEIEYVLLPGGEKKEYKINETIDYFEIAHNLGFRQKVMPQVDGKYILSNKSEKVQVVFEGENTYLKYATDFADWQEQIIEVTTDKLVLKNANNLEYHYKKPIPFTIK